MKQLAFITQGESEYDERLWTLLQETGIDPHEFVGLDYFGLVPFFVLAGATARPDAHTHGTDMHVTGVHIEVPDGLEEAFLATLREMLAEAYSDEEPEDRAGG